MKWILILIAMNTSEPDSSMFIAHKAFSTQYECTDSADHFVMEMTRNKLKSIAYCVSEKDLLQVPVK